jgi:hypothetical protein
MSERSDIEHAVRQYIADIAPFISRALLKGGN